jgi:hypothetical protein
MCRGLISVFLVLLFSGLHAQPCITPFDDLAVRLKDRPQDSIVPISSQRFDSLVAHLTARLHTVPLDQWCETDHVNLMRTLNTLMFEDRPDERFGVGNYARLESLCRAMDYDYQMMARLFPEWIPNRGMGAYFVKLDMELHGTPYLHSRFNVGKIPGP